MPNKTLVGLPSLIILSLCLGCAGTSAPRGWLLTATDAQRSGYGSWIEINYNIDNKSQFCDGEFISVMNDSVYCLNNDGLKVITLNTVLKAKISTFDSKYGKLANWTVTGTLASASHGILAVISVPLWVIIGTISSSSRSKEPISKLTSENWNELKKFARYPAGIPIDLDRTKLRTKPIIKKPHYRSRRR